MRVIKPPQQLDVIGAEYTDPTFATESFTFFRGRESLSEQHLQDFDGNAASFNEWATQIGLPDRVKGLEVPLVEMTTGCWNDQPDD